MSSTHLWRFNEGVIVPAGATIGGYIEWDGASYVVAQNQWFVQTTSSSDGYEVRSYWWFDTSWIPDGAVITGVGFKARYADAFYDSTFTGIYYYIQDNTLGTTLDSADFNSNNIYLGPGGGYTLGSDSAPFTANFFDSGIVTHPDAVSKVSKTAFTNIIAKMYAYDVTSAYASYTAPSAWRTVADIVPRLNVQFTINNAVFNVGTPAIVGTPTKVGTPVKVDTPTWLYNP